MVKRGMFFGYVFDNFRLPFQGCLLLQPCSENQKHQCFFPHLPVLPYEWYCCIDPRGGSALCSKAFFETPVFLQAFTWFCLLRKSLRHLSHGEVRQLCWEEAGCLSSSCAVRKYPNLVLHAEGETVLRWEMQLSGEEWRGVTGAEQ